MNKPAILYNPNKPWSVRFRRNASWVNSIGLVFSRVWFYAPMRLWDHMRDTVYLLTTGSIMLPVMLVSFVVQLVLGTLFGLAGFLRAPTEREIAQRRREDQEDA